MAKTVSISLSEDVFETLVERAKKSGLSKSGYITMALKRQYENEDVMSKMPDLMIQLSDINRKLTDK